MTRRKVQCPEAQEARRLGLKRYRTGKPCSRGHVAERYVTTDTCTECSLESGRKNRAADPERHREYLRAWVKADPERWRAIKQRWRDANRDKWNGYAQTYYAAHPDKRGAWAKANPERVRALALARYDPATQKRYRATWLAKPGSTEKQRAATATWAAANPDKVRVLAHTKRARRRFAPGKFSARDVAAIRDAQRNRCAYCREKLKGRQWQVDHKIALATGGTNHRSNLQICCETCNLRKHAKDPVDFAREMGLLI